jgi:hypothetical protein
MKQQFEFLEKADERVRWSVIILALAILSASAVYVILERIFLPYAWSPYGANSLLEVVQQKPVTFESGNTSKIYLRRWKMSSETRTTLRFSAKARRKDDRDLWGVSIPSPSFTPVWFNDSQGGFTRVQTPLGDDPYLFRSSRTSSPIALQQFRVELEMRSREIIPAQNCRGVWLQENGGSYASKCFPIELTPRWKKFLFDWTAPIEAHSSSIRVVLNDFDGLEYDVRNLVLSQKVGFKWEALSTLEPTGVQVWLDWKREDKFKPSPSVAITPDDIWRDYSLKMDGNIDTIVTALLSLERDRLVFIRSVRWKGEKLSYTALLDVPFRSSVWFSNPNYAGHSFASFTLFILFLLPSSVLGVNIGVLVSILGLVSVYFTESRAAWGGILIGIPWLIWFYIRENQKILLVAGLITVLAVGVTADANGFWERLTLGDRSSTTRQSIWETAVEYIVEHPFGGGSPIDFNKTYAENNPMAKEKVWHAHNFWLQMGVRFGWIGFLASALVTVFLTNLFWVVEKWRGLAFLLPIFWMNTIDYSLDNIGVWPVVLVASLFCLWKSKLRSVKILEETGVQNT